MFLWLWIAVPSLGVAPRLMAAEPPEPLDCTAEDGADAESVRSAQTAWAKYLGENGIEKSFPLDREGKVRVEMILIPPGRYYRGEGKNTSIITLTRPLWVGKYEVTQQQYATVAGRNPSHFVLPNPKGACQGDGHRVLAFPAIIPARWDQDHLNSHLSVPIKWEGFLNAIFA